ncbi:hypothetical protein LZ554_005868 [Drepanopeziza brunnea f. sp. 'monogermtubi']|nr:hypothetical protein LZ554_005868 [Drepanopeziza brunnea f. sp. 'monogermtubi']
MMLFQSQFPCLLLLLLSFLFTKAQADRKIIGYRMIPEHKATAVNVEHNPDAENNDEWSGPFYLSNKAGTGEDFDNDWYCVIQADEDKVDENGKAWIPREYNGIPEGIFPLGTRLWRNETAQIDYISSLFPDVAPHTVLRFLYFEEMDPPQVMMIFHPEFLSHNELDLWAECFPTLEDLYENYPDKTTVSWMDWTIEGDPGAAPPEDF